MTDATLVSYEADEGIATLTIRNPPANTYSYEMNRALDEAVLRARFDDSVHVFVLRGAGDRFFCAGAEDAREGISAYNQERKPSFRGC